MKFRFKALDKKRQPDQLDSPLILTSSRGWVALFVVLISAVMLGIWGFVGSIPRTTTSPGVLSLSGGLHRLEATSPGVLTDWQVRTGDEITQGQRLGTIQGHDGQEVPVSAPEAGIVTGVLANEGAVVGPGRPLADFEASTDVEGDLQVTLLVPADQVPYVHVGQEVTMALPGVNPRAFGRLVGTVAEVGNYPVTTAEVERLTGDTARAEQASSVGPHLVVVTLKRDPSTYSGFQWTSASGPPLKLNSRTPVEGEISLGASKPFTVLFGI